MVFIQSCFRFISSYVFSPRKIKVSNQRSGLIGWCGILAVMLGGACGQASAQLPAATSTTLSLTSGDSPIATVTAGSVVTLTATVVTGSTPVSSGVVKFCDVSAAYCEDTHLVGTAQLTTTGSAVVKFRPGIGSHSYKAVFIGTNIYATSSSSALSLSVTGSYGTSTAIHSAGGPGNYQVTATVTGIDLNSPAPTGSISFLDTSNGNAILGAESLESGSPSLSLLNSANPAVGFRPAAIAVADFNGDGILDFATLNSDSQTITVQLGIGDGTFTAAASQAVGRYPNSFTVADFNGDDIADLAVVFDNDYLGSTGSTVTILLGNGDGTFTATPTSPSVGNNPYAIAAGDFNGDGKQDLAVANLIDDTVTILLGNNDGTFTSVPSSPATGMEPSTIAVADFNGDGKLDLAVGNLASDTLTVLLGNGDGTFTAAASPATGVYPYAVVVADLNRDGVPDLVVSNEDSNVTVLLGAGNGTFTVAPSPGFMEPIAVGDFNGDNISDLAGTTGYKTMVFLGKGDGTFSAGPTFTPKPLNSELQFLHIASADFNGDGHMDLASVGLIVYGSGPNGQSQILLSDPQSTATATASVTVGPGPHSVEAGYPGDDNYSSSSSASITLNGNPVSTSLNLSASIGPYSVGRTVTLTATLSPYTAAAYSTDSEPVTFYNGSTPLGTGTLSSGVATISFTPQAAGQFSLTAAYAGESIFAGSTSNSQTISVPVSTTLTLGVSSGPYTFGKPLTLTATLSPYANAGFNTNNQLISFFNRSTLLGTGALSNGVATLRLNSPGVADYSFGGVFAGDSNFVASNSNSIVLSVVQGTPTITWAAPAAITYGTALSSTQLRASTPVAGTFSYSPAAGAVLNAGVQTLQVTFTPDDSVDYAGATASVPLTVNKAASTITWATPAAIPYGTALSATQLNATASVAGTFTYNPAAGTVLTAGSSKAITATFTPTDAVNYQGATATVYLTVNAVTPTITWATPAAIPYGTALSATQLNATASVAGTFVYSPAAGTVLSVGSQTLSVTFTPTDTRDYTSGVTGSATLVVNKATPTVTWPTPAAIPYGTVLSATQLNATASVAGTFVYSPAAGTVLGVGSHTITATFTPADTQNYTSGVTGSVNIAVGQATPILVLTASANPAIVSGSVTFTATVSGAGGPPTGTVAFLDGTTALGSGTLTAGVATYASSSLVAGSHAITAVYSGDASFVAVTSAAVTEVIEDFTLAPPTGGSTSATAPAGGQAVYTLAFGPPTGTTFPAAVTFTVTGLPTGATATFTPATILAGATATNVTLTVALPSRAALTPERGPFPGGAIPVALGLILLPLAGRLRKAARGLNKMVCLAILGIAGATLMAGMSGCGGSSSPAAPVSYTLTVTATSGSLSHSTTLNLTVQ